MPSIPDKFAIPLKVIDPQAIKAVAPHAKGYMPSIGPADWQFSGPAGRDPYDIFGQPHLFYPYKVTSQDDWATVAARAKLKDDPKKLIRMNFFGIDDPAVVNWFLMNYVGCVRTRDGVNCSFSDDARPGIVWLPRSPHVVWPPKPHSRGVGLRHCSGQGGNPGRVQGVETGEHFWYGASARGRHLRRVASGIAADPQAPIVPKSCSRWSTHRSRSTRRG